MTEQSFDAMRRAMVASQLRTTGVNDPRVLRAMGEVPRERFVAPERAALAYADATVPLGGGRALSPPMALGLLLTEARLTGSERVLVVGSGSGYAVAVLAKLVRSVVAVETDATLAAHARATVGGDVEFVEGPLEAGYAKGAPYDFVLIDGVVDDVPQAIVDQVADGGRIAAALNDQGVTRLAIGRVASGKLGMKIFADAAAAPLPGFAKAQAFSF